MIIISMIMMFLTVTLNTVELDVKGLVNDI